VRILVSPIDDADTANPVVWRQNGNPRWLDATSLVVALLGGLLVVTAMVLVRPANDSILAASFLAIYIAAVSVGHYGNWRRRPARVGFSDIGVHVQHRTGTIRLIPWELVQDVRLARIPRDVHAKIRHMDGKVEDRAHIYGEAAVELKRRFDALRLATEH
jgi:hypothetical protein